MISVQISGWRPGFLKVSHTQLLQSRVSLSLSEAKSATDRVLVGDPVVVNVPSMAAAERLVSELAQLGAVAVISSPGAAQSNMAVHRTAYGGR